MFQPGHHQCDSQSIEEVQNQSTHCRITSADREATAALLNAVGYVDLIIPRGSSSLIHFVRENARIPVIETGAGICHTYFDEFGDTNKGADIIHNAKTRRVSVCNALDCTIIHEKRLADLPLICEKLKTAMSLFMLIRKLTRH